MCVCVCVDTCNYPLSVDNSVRVSGYEQPALEGSMITVSCSSGLVLIGPSTSTCMKNGKWEPDPRNVECEG